MRVHKYSLGTRRRYKAQLSTNLGYWNQFVCVRTQGTERYLAQTLRTNYRFVRKHLELQADEARLSALGAIMFSKINFKPVSDIE